VRDAYDASSQSALMPSIVALNRSNWSFTLPVV
jgi:hypothetical protein